MKTEDFKRNDEKLELLKTTQNKRGEDHELE
jgi:hypothetical protein